MRKDVVKIPQVEAGRRPALGGARGGGGGGSALNTCLIRSGRTTQRQPHAGFHESVTEQPQGTYGVTVVERSKNRWCLLPFPSEIPNSHTQKQVPSLFHCNDLKKAVLMWERRRRAKDGLARGDGERHGRAKASERLSKETRPWESLAPTRSTPVSAKASLPGLPRQCHSHGLEPPPEPEDASREGHSSRQSSDSPGILDAFILN